MCIIPKIHYILKYYSTHSNIVLINKNSNCNIYAIIRTIYSAGTLDMIGRDRIDSGTHNGTSQPGDRG